MFKNISDVTALIGIAAFDQTLFSLDCDFLCRFIYLDQGRWMLNTTDSQVNLLWRKWNWFACSVDRFCIELLNKMLDLR